MGVRFNFNFLGEVVLGDCEVVFCFEGMMVLLVCEDVDYVLIKILVVVN